MSSAEAEALARIAEALERMAPAPLEAPDFAQADAFVWHVDPDRLTPVARQHEQSEDAVFQLGPYTFRPAMKMLLTEDERKIRSISR